MYLNHPFNPVQTHNLYPVMLINFLAIKLIISSSIKKGRLIVQMGELWSFVNNKDNKLWAWVALEVLALQIIGLHIRDRSHEGAKALLDS